MTLDEYRRHTGASYRKLASLFGVSPMAVWHWTRGAMPSRDAAARIEQATGGAVTALEAMFPQGIGKPGTSEAA